MNHVPKDKKDSTAQAPGKPDAMSRYVVKVAVAFTIGGIVGLVGMLIWQTIGVLGFAVFAGPMISYAIGGAISGASLGKGWRPVLGFGAAFVFLGSGIPLLLIAFQGMSASLKEWLVIIPWFLMYAIGGGIGAAVSGLGWRMALASAAAFGAGGSIAFAAIMISFDIFGGALILLAVYVGPVIPHVLGGALLAVALAYPSHKRKKLGLCLQCGYDLRGSEDRCPECGTPFEKR